jgi:hypothetical protein
MSIKTSFRNAGSGEGPSRAKIGTLALLALGIAAGCALASCSPENLVGNAPLPPDVPDPGQTHTPAGAVEAYRGALLLFRSAVGGDGNSMVPISGLLTDELRSGELGQQGSITDGMKVDSRVMPEYGGSGDDINTPAAVRVTYELLQKARGQSHESRGALIAYPPVGSADLRGHLDAIEGYSDVYLADLFCSGIPLSTLDFGKDFTYQPGSSTTQVYTKAVALFDSALTLAVDSERVLNFARVGKARALLALGNYAGAATAVSSVPDGFQYVMVYDQAVSPGPNDFFLNRSFAYADFNLDASGTQVTMVDREGANGLPFMSSGDPRTAFVDDGTNQFGRPKIHPAKYSIGGDGPLVIASGVEARLIEVEAALKVGGATWLTTLNTLRTDGTFDTQPNADDPTKIDTLWHAGTGGVAGLKPLEDPVDGDARVDLVFSERAFWLFLTGTRQGDLRRLVRQYGRQPNHVYPTGPYPGAFNSYGNDVTAPITGEERISNPLFTGCAGRGA